MRLTKSDTVVFSSPTPGLRYKKRPAAYVVIINRGGMVAAVKGTRGYFLPGGGSLPGESPENTVSREVREELARGVRIICKLGEAVQYFSADAQHFQMHAIFFTAEFSGEPSGRGECELEWLQMVEAKEVLFHQCHVWAICQA